MSRRCRFPVQPCPSRSPRGNPSLALSSDMVLDSRAERQCYEDIPILLSPGDQRIVDACSFVGNPYATLDNVMFDVAPAPLQEERCWAVDMSLCFTVSLDCFISRGGEPVRVTGTATCNSRCTLYGGEGVAPTFRSDGNGWNGAPIACLQAADPIALNVHLIDCPQSGEVAKLARVSIGVFTVTSLQRPTRAVVPARGFIPPIAPRPRPPRTPCDDFLAQPFPRERFFWN